jgi:DNA-binding transcriptional LysR family regulator
LRKNTIVLRGNLPFTQLQAFEAVVRLGSFNAARTELEGSNVSRHVADLEHRLGKKLLLRSPRGALTPEGQLLFGYLTRSFEQIRRLMGAIEAGSLEPESVHLLLQEALFAPTGPPGPRFRP